MHMLIIWVENGWSCGVYNARLWNSHKNVLTRRQTPHVLTQMWKLKSWSHRSRQWKSGSGVWADLGEMVTDRPWAGRKACNVLETAVTMVHKKEQDSQCSQHKEKMFAFMAMPATLSDHYIFYTYWNVLLYPINRHNYHVSITKKMYFFKTCHLLYGNYHLISWGRGRTVGRVQRGQGVRQKPGGAAAPGLPVVFLFVEVIKVPSMFINKYKQT